LLFFSVHKHILSPVRVFLFCFVVVAVIGFHQYLYSVKEATDIVLPVGVIFGDLERSAEVVFSVESGSAIGKF